MLAAGYLTAARLEEQLMKARSLAAGRPIGVNLFVPRRANIAEQALSEEELEARAASVSRFREQLLAQGIPAAPAEDCSSNDDDDWDAKCELLLAEGPEFVSFTFGCPDRAVIERFHTAGIPTAVTVTDEIEAVRALGVGAAALVVQGCEAGGHRGTHREQKRPQDRGALELLEAILPIAGEKPVIVAGGIARRRHVRTMLEAGAWAVQVGTALLLADEAGTHPVHQAALETDENRVTAMTRAFSGRWARSLSNDYLNAFPAAPGAYPEINQLTAPMKARARDEGNPEQLHLWAGTEWRHSRSEPAAEIIRRLAPNRN